MDAKPNNKHGAMVSLLMDHGSHLRIKEYKWRESLAETASISTHAGLPDLLAMMNRLALKLDPPKHRRHAPLHGIAVHEADGESGDTL